MDGVAENGDRPALMRGYGLGTEAQARCPSFRGRPRRHVADVRNAHALL
jgi:hypothetical protein